MKQREAERGADFPKIENHYVAGTEDAANILTYGENAGVSFFLYVFGGQLQAVGSSAA